MIYDLGDRKVTIDAEDYWIADNATVIGSVIIKNNASIWFNVTVRGDNDVITIGENSNVQDGSVLHTDGGIQLTIGEGVTVGHQVMLHGCTIGNNTLVGIDSVILNGAKIGNNCLIGANSLIAENKEIPDGSLVMGSPGKVIRQLDNETKESLIDSALHYQERAAEFSKHLDKIS